MNLTAGFTADFPQRLAIRPAVPSDLHDVLHLRQALELADSGVAYTTAERLSAEWEALGPHLADQVWVAIAADGSLCAAAVLARIDQEFVARLWVAPNHHESGLERELLARAERQARALGQAAGDHSIALFAQATSAHPATQQALLQSGFVVTSIYEEMELALPMPPMNPDVVSGIEIRPFAAGQDATVVYRADEEAFQDQCGHTARSFEQWSRRLTQSEAPADPALWLIAWDGGEVAGAALGEVIKGVGWIHHLFVRRPWRRRGLGAALTRSAAVAFARQGVGVVRLNVDGQSLTNAHELYRRVGFRVVSDYTNYEKIMPLA
jgi:mycothiol synthase